MVGIMQAPGKPKKKLLTPERVNEVADSLDKEAVRKIKFAAPQKSIAEAGIKRGEGDKQMIVKSTAGVYADGPTYNERMKIANDELSSADKDIINAARYRKLAASKKKMQ